MARARSAAVALVSVDHHSGLPAGDQHQLVLVAALRQPAGGEGMPELVGMHSRKPRGPGPVVQAVVERLADSVLRLAE